MNFLIICKFLKSFHLKTSPMIFNTSLAIRKNHWPSAFTKVKVDLQQICILQFPQNSEDQNQLCLASPPVAEVLGEIRKFLLDILKVSEITVWASSRAAAGRAGILWGDVFEQLSVLKGSKRKLRLNQRIYRFLGGEDTREVSVHKIDKSSIAKNIYTCYLYFLSIICSKWSWELLRDVITWST